MRLLGLFPGLLVDARPSTPLATTKGDGGRWNCRDGTKSSVMGVVAGERASGGWITGGL